MNEYILQYVVFCFSENLLQNMNFLFPLQFIYRLPIRIYAQWALLIYLQKWNSNSLNSI